MVPAGCTGYFQAVWYRTYSEICSGGRFMSSSESPQSRRKSIFGLYISFLKRTIQNRLDNPTEGGIFEARVGFYNYLEIFGSILI